MWPLLFPVNSPNFRQWNSNSHIIFQIILTFKLGFNFAVAGIHNFFSLSKLWNNGNVSLGFTSKFQIPNLQFTKEWKKLIFLSSTLIFCQIVRIVFPASYVCRRVSLWLNCHFSRKQMFTIVYATSLCQFKCYEYY